MCVAQTAKRRRRQHVLDGRYKKRSPEALLRRAAEHLERLKKMQNRTGSKK